MYILSTDIDWLNPSGVKRIKNIPSLLKTKMTNLIHMIQRYEDYGKSKIPILVHQLQQHQGLFIMHRMYKI